MAYVLSSAALINAISPQHDIILEPPALIKGNVTPVSGRMSVAPKTFNESCTTNSPAAQHAEIE